MGNIVAMPGYAVPRELGEPVPEVVEILENLLDRARRGELEWVRVAGRVLSGDGGCILTAYAGRADNIYECIGALEMLKDREKGLVE